MYYTQNETKDWLFQSTKHISNMLPNKKGGIWPLKFTPDFSKSEIYEAIWRNDVFYFKNNMSVTTLSSIMNLLEYNGTVSSKQIETALKNNSFHITVIGSGSYSIMNRDMAYKLYKNLRIYMKEQVSFLDWKERSSEPYSETDYNVVIDHIVQILIHD